MVYRYYDFIKESASNARAIYWDNNDFILALNSDWTEIKIEGKRFSKYYSIVFRVGPNKYDIQSAILDKDMEEFIFSKKDMSEKFKQKFYKEFWKNAPEYVNNMAYDPKFLGDVKHVRDAAKYNM